jgi:hypothetical protein
MFSLVWFSKDTIPWVFQILVVVFIDAYKAPKALQILI